MHQMMLNLAKEAAADALGSHTNWSSVQRWWCFYIVMERTVNCQNLLLDDLTINNQEAHHEGGAGTCWRAEELK